MISGRNIRKNQDGSWTTPRTNGALREAGLWEIGKYIERRKETLKRYAENREIMSKCRQTQASSSDPNQLVWWGE